MKATKLELDAQSFAEHIAATPKQADRVKACIAKREELLGAYTVATTRNYLTTYRAAITAKIAKSAALLRSLKISNKANNKLFAKYKNKVQSRTENAEYIRIENPQLLIDKASELLKSAESRYKIALGLMLATGRRSVEILLTAEFAAVKKSPNELLFMGQLKKREGESDKPYKIPALLPAAEIIAALAELRKIKTYAQDITPKQVHDADGKNLGKYAKKELATLLGADVSPHDLRKAYAAIAYSQTDKKQSFRSWAEVVLGHSGSGRDGGLTTETYLKYIV
jgi:integrase